MKRRITKLSFALIAVALLLCVLPMSALAAQSGAYTYTVSNGKATITRYTGSATAITTPSTLGGHPVTAIGKEAFLYCDRLTSVTIPYGVTSIGDGAFYGCWDLASITIPGSVLSIGAEAFLGCNLTSITIPGSVTNIADDAFVSCRELAAIHVSASNLKYTSQDGVLFNKTRTKLIKYPMAHAGTTYTIPGSVTAIGPRAFDDCNSLTGVTIPYGVTTIGDGAFYGCSSLTSITIPGSVTGIGQEAFFACGDLTSVTIPVSVASIGDGAFASCAKLSAIHVNASNQKYTSQDGILFNKAKTKLVQYPIAQTRTTYAIPDSVTAIGPWAFAGCDGLTSITIPSGVTIIGKRAFYDCYYLTSVPIPYGVISIGDRAFGDCRNLLSITIPGSVTSIGAEAFVYCDNLTSITIPGSVASIGEGAFSLCRYLASVTISNGVVSIGKEAFYGCWSLPSITIPASVTNIGAGAFSSNGLTAISVNTANPKYSSQGGVLFNKAKTELVQYPSSHARSSYTIPGGVTGIWPWAFNNSRYLKGVMIPGSVASIGEGAFYGCGLTSVTISNGVNSIGKDAFTYCGNLTSVTIPASVTQIADLAFDGCGLDSVFFQGNAPSMGKHVFDGEPGFTVYYRKGKTGFTNPWHGYPTSTYILPAAPTVKVAFASSTSAKLTWGAVAGAAKYEVYRATSINGPWTKRTETASASYTDTGLATATAYYYKVRAYGIVDTVKVYGDYSAVVSPSAPAAPANVKAVSASYNSVKVTWGAVTGASGYLVYRATSSNGTYTLAAVFPSGSTAIYTNAGLTAGKTYYYKLRAYRTVGATKVYGDYSAVASARPVPALPTGLKAARATATSIKLTWNAVTGASGYVVYRATSSTGAYTLVAVLPSGSTASYINNGLTTGTTYYYKLRAYRTVGAAKVYGGYSAVVSAKP